MSRKLYNNRDRGLTFILIYDTISIPNERQVQNMCGNYGCKNCVCHKVWYSNDYWLPDEHECIIGEFDKPAFEISDEELENIMDRVWTYGEEWNTVEEQICPYYKEYIPRPEDF